MTILVSDFMNTMQDIAPLEYAESWDNVGLLIGRRADPVKHIMLTIDFTEEILAEAIELGADLVLTYHPIMFKPIQSITYADTYGRALLTTMRNGLAVYSPHSALDAAEDGITDWLADMVGSGYRRALIPFKSVSSRGQIKIVTFVPTDAADRLRDALASAGAGRIGEYEQCSFTSPGTGTFRGSEESHPTVGEPGQLVQTDEVRLEMICPSPKTLALLVTTLKQFHPYEEPAFDLYPLESVPSLHIGTGRKIVLDQPSTVGEVARDLKDHLGIAFTKVTDPDTEVTIIGIIPGSGSSVLDTALEQGCDLFITGEMSHHHAIVAESQNCSVILTGHTNSERGYLPILEKRINEKQPDLITSISKVDRSRFSVM